jgi:hypothetical protein
MLERLQVKLNSVTRRLGLQGSLLEAGWGWRCVCLNQAHCCLQQRGLVAQAHAIRVGL